MKTLLILAAGYLAVNASLFNAVLRMHGNNGWYVPSTGNSLNWVNTEKAKDYLEARQNVDKSFDTPVDFYLYTTSNARNAQRIFATIESIVASNFNSDNPTRLIIHDYLQDYTSIQIQNIRDAWLSVGEYNVIIVDWPIAIKRMYMSPASAVPKTGEIVANLIEHLVNYHGMLLETCHVIGYGLGAHVAGYAGKNIRKGKIGTIIGLDPSLPSFSYEYPLTRLNSTDALYVETIQTDINVTGFKNPIGKATFYPNGGFSQPGCNDYNCDHRRSLDYYVESVALDNFASIRCENIEDVFAANCGAALSSVRMGSDKNTFSVSGIFYVPVIKNSPYGVLSKSERNAIV